MQNGPKESPHLAGGKLNDCVLPRGSAAADWRLLAAGERANKGPLLVQNCAQLCTFLLELGPNEVEGAKRDIWRPARSRAA